MSASPQRIIYGYSWYLDVVLPAPNWQWMGLVLPDNQGKYRAVMPVPLRRKTIAGVTVGWVVHQPFFCQFLAVFSPDDTLDSEPFFRAMQQHFRYGASFHSRRPVGDAGSSTVRASVTHVLDLAVGYETLLQRYSRDRQLNLRRAMAANWTVQDSTDPQPLLDLFRQNHADTIDGGVADWAYATFDRLLAECQQRGLAKLRYAIREGRVEAGALFVQEGNRIVYLFNAASEAGRRGNARTLLIDQMIRENAGTPLTFDFESPEKASIRAFYQSFGATEEPFWLMRWNRLSWVERAVVALKRGRK